MYKVFIADDEKHIRMLITKVIPWEEMGLVLEGEAADGASALQQILDLKPDIVIMDIRMPEMDGLEVIHQAKSSNIDCVFLLISGHREFEYAHAAIEYGVDNYILKPISREALLNAIQKGILKLERKAHINLPQDQSIHHELLCDYFMRAYLQKEKSLANMSLSEMQNTFGIPFSKGSYITVAVQPDETLNLTNDQYQNLLEQLKEYFSKSVSNANVQFFCGCNSFACILVLHSPKADSLTPFLQSLIDRATTRFYSFCSITAGVSNVTERPELLSLDEAISALESRITFGISRIIHYNDALFTSLNPSIFKKVDELTSVIDILHTSKFQEWFDTLAIQIDHDEIDPHQIIDLIMRICHRSADLLCETDEATQKDQMLSMLETTVRRSSNRSMLFARVRDSLTGCIEDCLQRRQNRDSYYIRKAKEYIHQNYDKNITLENISDAIYINPTYFSVLFKKEVGINYSDYLLEYRLEQAKRMLSDHTLTIEEISLRVGYRDTRYFSRLFAKQYGIKPSEYRKLL